ncbi:ParB/RepB/Spo0J family partition protein (plasmid) [Skermanella sp. TT6]|uniref:ParB/RepB/Spo0J family partition protein n=1 Tax=Skermanella cutis TaxID=2775420 RepID=A0ABX7BLH4_9PROT|nr:ParB/RepB/Spo0J family partition protein [Skermanella sp. TT6]QQP93857.1 ParB/RepB/Spo0J family partition protein [Skermanella sp. TT6]
MSRSKSDLTNNRGALTRETGRVALFGTSEDSEYLMLDLDQVQTNPNQPRKYFDEDSLNGLASSIAERGVLQPILVKEIERGVFEIIAGERRWRASKIAGKTQIPSLVVKTDDATLLAVLENLQREDLDAVETAQALATLIKSYKSTHESLGRLLGKSQTYVTRTLHILDLHKTILVEYQNNRHVAMTMLAELASIEDPDEQLRLWEKAKSGLSVAGVREMKQGRAPAVDKTNRFTKATMRFTKDLVLIREQGGALEQDQRELLLRLRDEINALLT